MTPKSVKNDLGDEGLETQFRPFPNYSLSLFYRRMLYELLQTLRESLEVARQPPAARNPPTHPTTKPIIDSRGRQARGGSRLVLGTSWPLGQPLVVSGLLLAAARPLGKASEEQPPEAPKMSHNNRICFIARAGATISKEIGQRTRPQEPLGESVGEG